jgi:aminomethyltransferase
MRLDALTRDHGHIDAEVAACRNDAALFDFSFMSRGVASGPRTRARVQALAARPLDALRPGRIVYGLRTDDRGQVLADLTVWQTGTDRYEVFSGRPEDIAALGADDLTAESCVLSLQGPGSLRALAGLAALDVLSQVGYFGHCRLDIAGVACQVGRLGYTGERGFEFVVPAAAKQRLWEALSTRARPAGFAAADVLRIEAGFVLFCNEFRPMVTPAEAGLARFGAAGAPPSPPRVELVGFTAKCRERPVLYQPGGPFRFPPEAGEIVVTSAAWAAGRGGVVGLGYVKAGAAGRPLADPGGGFQDIRRADLPFVDPAKRRVRGGWGADLLPAPEPAFH